MLSRCSSICLQDASMGVLIERSRTRGHSTGHFRKLLNYNIERLELVMCREILEKIDYISGHILSTFRLC